jgi:hypothetical protein
VILQARMSDAVVTALIAAIGEVLAAGLELIHWAVKEWASVRREAMKAEAEVAAEQRTHNERLLELQRADNARMREALLERARSNTALLGKLDVIAGGLEALRADRSEPRPSNSGPSSAAKAGVRRLQLSSRQPLPQLRGPNDRVAQRNSEVARLQLGGVGGRAPAGAARRAAVALIGSATKAASPTSR